MNVVVKEDTPILINNTEHRNFVETDKILPKGTILKGEFINIIGKRKGQEFTYRMFKDNDGIFIYKNKIEPMEVNLNTTGDAETRIVDMPNAKVNTRVHALISVAAGVIGYAVAKKMGKTNKMSFVIGGAVALAGYGAATYMTKNQIIVFKTK